MRSERPSWLSWNCPAWLRRTRSTAAGEEAARTRRPRERSRVAWRCRIGSLMDWIEGKDSDAAIQGGIACIPTGDPARKELAGPFLSRMACSSGREGGRRIAANFGRNSD